MPNISSATTINSVQLTEQSTAPATPSTGYLRIYASSGSILRVVDDSGNDYPLTTGSMPPDLSGQTFVVLSTSSALTAERLLTGTANRVSVTDGGANNAVTLSAPQDLHTGAQVNFSTGVFNVSISTTSSASMANYTSLSVGTGANSSASVTFRGQYFSELIDDGTLTTDSTINWSSGNEHKITLGANIVLSFSNGVTGGRYVLLVVQDSTGSRTVTWTTSVKWGNAGVSTLSTTASKVDLFTFLFDGTNYLGNASLGF
jgi:hypothetical protein